MVFSLLGKFFISCVLATVYSYTSELFPDSSRTTVVGLCSMSGRIGAILAPELEQLVECWPKSNELESWLLTYLTFLGEKCVADFALHHFCWCGHHRRFTMSGFTWNSSVTIASHHRRRRRLEKVTASKWMAIQGNWSVNFFLLAGTRWSSVGVTNDQNLTQIKQSIMIIINRNFNIDRSK